MINRKEAVGLIPDSPGLDVLGTYDAGDYWMVSQTSNVPGLDLDLPFYFVHKDTGEIKSATLPMDFDLMESVDEGTFRHA